MEIEIKFALESSFAHRLRQHPLLAGIKPALHRLYSVYFDTPAFDLLRAGVAVRLRRVGCHWVQTVKARAGSDGMLAQRSEWEVKVTDKRPNLELLPAKARQLIPAGVCNRLSPVFETEFWRTTWEVAQEGSLIEAALDQGEIRASGQAWPISELELELKSGALADLFVLADRLLTDLPLRLEPRSKAKRGYELAGALPLAPVKAIAPDLNADVAASTAFVAIARACMAEFEANLPGFLHTQEPNPEHVHSMQVAMQRLHAVANLLRFMQRDYPAWAGELKWLMRELAVARDWDVFVTETLPRVKKHLDRPACLDALTEVAQNLRWQAHDRARMALTSSRLARLWLTIERDLATTVNSPISTREWAKAALERCYHQVFRLGNRLDKLHPAQCHALCIAGRKLCHAAEFFACLHLKAARRFIAALAGLQDELEILNAAALTEGLLEEAKQAGGQAVGEGVDWVAGFLVRQRDLHLKALARRWREFQGVRLYWR